MRFLVLGPLEVIDDRGEPLPIAGSKERTVLASLIARSGRVVRADDLVEELWGDDPPRTAERTLVSYVSRLRRALVQGPHPGNGSELISSRVGGYTFEPGLHEIDAVRFQDLSADGHRLLEGGNPGEAVARFETALGLWRGVAYQDFRSSVFGGVEGERLEELRRSSVEALADSRLAAAGNEPTLVGDLEAMVADEPLRERRWGQLMLALYRSGRQAEALQAFARARSVLVEELGVEPGPSLQRLQAAILAHDPDLDPRPPRPVAAPREADVCPYKGLARFEAVDAEFFFGRDRMVAEAVGHLVAKRFLALVGPSGSGKSSLLRAGIVPVLAAGGIPGSDRWPSALMRPGEHPMEALRRMQPDGADRAVLAVDQFEEVFTACTDQRERDAFLDALTRAALDPDGSLTVIIVMRADFYGRCADHRPLASLLAADQILLGPMDAAELRLAIERPADRVGLAVEPELSEALIADTAGQPGALPLLSTALLELWTRRRDGSLHLDDYRQAGGVEGAVARLAEEAFHRLDDDEQVAAKRILLRLAAPGDGTDVVRRRAPLTEFDLDRNADAARALAVLADARLVVVSEGTAEVAHEALLREWPRLQGWLEESAEGRTVHRHLTEASAAWGEGGRDAGDLYRGARLSAAAYWAATNDADLNELERAFIGASRAASESESVRARRTDRRLRALLAGVAVLLAASLVVGSLALRQRDEARGALALADAGRLASRSLVEEDPALALILAKEAVDLSDSPDTRSALFAALQRGPAITGRMYAPGGPAPAGDETQWIAISPDGSTLAIGDAGSDLGLFDAGARRYASSVDVGSGTERATFAPDGVLVVVTSDDELVSVDVATGRTIARVAAEHSVDAIAFSPDGTQLVTAEASGDLEFLVPRDPTSLEPIAARVRVPGVVTTAPVPPLGRVSAAFTADGRSLVTTSTSGTTVQWSEDLAPEQRFPIGGDGLALSPAGAVAALIQNDDDRAEGDLAFLDLDTGEVRVGSGGHHGPGLTQYEATGAAFTLDGGSVVTTGNDSRLIVWDMASASVREVLQGTGDLPLRGPVTSSDGTTGFTTDRNRDVVVWDLGGADRFARPFTAGSGFPAWPWFAISPDGRTIAVPSASGSTFGRSGSIELIDASTFRVDDVIDYPDSSPEGLAFSPDSATLAVGAWNEQRGQSDVRLWDVASGEPLTAELQGIPRRVVVWAMQFSPDGATLAGAARVLGPERGGVYLWNVGSDQLAGRFATRRPVNALAFAPDGSLLAAPTGWADGGDTIIWDTRARRVVRTIHTDDAAAYWADVSDDGRLLLAGGQTSSVRLFDIATGQPRGPQLTGLTGSTDTADLSPDGTMVVGADTAGNVLLWDRATGTVIGGPFPGPPDGAYLAASFTPDGRHVVVMSDSGSGWSWNVDPTDWATRACAIAGRSLTPDEWREFVPDRPYRTTCGS
jgi:DNA-binding SARP family transcriptional activator/WD40 repeat protein